MKITLDSIRSSIEDKYSHAEVSLFGHEVALCNPLRLPKDVRDKLLEAAEGLSEAEGEDAQKEALRDLIVVASSDAKVATAMLDAIRDEEPDEELLFLTEIVSQYMSRQEVGEA